MFPDLADEGKDGDAQESTGAMVAKMGWGMAWLAPRGVGPSAWSGGERKQTQIRRRFQLLGRTLDTLRVWDVARGAAVLQARPELADAPLWLQGETPSASVWSLYAATFLPQVARIDLHHLLASHLEGPDFLNVLRVLDVPDTVLMVAERTNVRLYGHRRAEWLATLATAKSLGWDAKRIEYRELPPPEDVVLGDAVVSIVYNGKPVSHGEVAFESEAGEAVLAPVKAGRVEFPVYRGLRPGLPVGKHRIALRAAGGVPHKYASVETSGLSIDVKEGTNSFDIDIKD
jgi:hypothetical protein